jgi:hypothetical protein
MIGPVYKKLLLIAGIIYLIGVTIILSDLYIKVIRIEHELLHVKGIH